MKRFISPFSLIFRTVAQVFRERVYAATTLISALAFFSLYLLTPTWLVPSTTLAFELSRLSLLNYTLLGTLALLTGILLSLELFSFRRTRSSRVRSATEGGVGLVASLTGGILAAASCGCGLGILLGAVGLSGGAVFVAAHQTPIVIGMLVIVGAGLYFSARRAAGICATCVV